MYKVFSVILLSILVPSLLQASVREHSNDPLVRLAEDAVRSLRVHGQFLTSEERQELNRLYSKSLSITETDRRRPPRRRPPMAFSYTGHCEIDDDLSFDPGQDVIGEVRGRRVLELHQECDAIAQNRYGSNYTYRVTRIESRRPALPIQYSAVCSIDDDFNFDPNQFVQGELVGSSYIEIARECQEIADFISPSANTKRLTRAAQPRDPRRDWVYTGVCHIDDDLNFDLNQNVFPMSGRSVIDLDNSCRDLAIELFGRNSTFKVKL